MEPWQQTAVAGCPVEDQSAAGHLKFASWAVWLEGSISPSRGGYLPKNMVRDGETGPSPPLPGPYSQEDISFSYFVLSFLWNQRTRGYL